MPLHIVFDNPVIPTNTGNAIRTAAVTGAKLHLVEPLGFNFDDKHLKRAGLDYHDLADLKIHADFDACMEALPGARVFAFTTSATKWFSDVEYTDGDVLLFGTEPSGLPAEHLAHPRITEEVRIPMVPARRSMNLSNAASTAVYEAWRQLGFPGGVQSYTFTPSNDLNSVEDVAAYLEATIEEDGDDSAAIKRALGNIARSQNFSEIARQAGMSREGLYKALSEDGNPSLATIIKVSHALGLKLRFEAA